MRFRIPKLIYPFDLFRPFTYQSLELRLSSLRRLLQRRPAHVFDHSGKIPCFRGHLHNLVLNRRKCTQLFYFCFFSRTTHMWPYSSRHVVCTAGDSVHRGDAVYQPTHRSIDSRQFCWHSLQKKHLLTFELRSLPPSPPHQKRLFVPPHYS